MLRRALPVMGHTIFSNMKIEDLKPAIAVLPPGLLANLEEATELSDMAAIDQAITDIRVHNAPLADMLAQLAGNFKYDELLTLVQSVEDKHK